MQFLAYLLAALSLALIAALQAPAPPQAKLMAVEISAGGQHSCAIDREQRIHCWGSNRHGQLDAPEGWFTSVSAGETHTCAIDVDGRLVCWGGGKFVGPAQPEGRFVQVSAGEDHTCALRTDGRLLCFGWNRNGQSTPPAGA